MFDTTKKMAADMLEWSEARNRGALMRKIDIREYTGFSREKVDELTAYLQPVGAKATYFYLDVAEALVNLGTVAKRRG